ncbi:MAG: hypothetical protein HYZ40_15695 [Rhodospirillales bacterium]|nr:hypothetical protein [Rhodospirillales bacterium]
MKRNNRTIITGLLGPSVLSLWALALLSGCGDGGLAPHLQGARPGADRSAPVLKALPPPDSARPHDAGVAPADETRAGAAVGSSVSGTGGQKAQKEEAEKQAAEQSRKDRERAQRAAEARKAAPPAEQPPAVSPPAEPPSTPPSND